MSKLTDIYAPGRPILREVGLRDGLQLTRTYPSTTAKADWIRREYAAGIRHFEVGSFLPASRYPQFADIRQMTDLVNDLGGAWSLGLALNQRGASDALQAGLSELTVVLSATEQHNLANARRSREQSLAEIENAVRMRDEAGSDTLINVGIAMAFGCSLSGWVDPAEVERLVQRCLDIGVDLVGVADTVGYAGPRQIAALCSRLTSALGDRPYVVHLHDTRGMGIANAMAALQAGARIFDASLAGLGGCPFAPGATGNVVMEDLVYLMETSGFPTGVDLDALIPIRDILAQAMPEETLHGTLAQAGAPAGLNWRAAAA
ncbi:hydroxymethylglutaryl-CoA lyase [Paracoccus sp. M683]|uniref:hydroxymethylglutaryl-CoA lyase n=1 Tax=Paracoccus sp. M683 TaxID=2594268 RepID=UPI00117F2A6F|nr:hydroxymethylglutaryl-CoA lyase [Paracoccus sp. M683]TRW95365.1 hydroxymethylglutaryl-CoA lyase [Paracoccus sp. M683]